MCRNGLCTSSGTSSLRSGSPRRTFLLARCGFDSLEPPSGVDLEAVRRALERYDVAYQPGAALLELRRQRFFFVAK